MVGRRCHVGIRTSVVGHDSLRANSNDNCTLHPLASPTNVTEVNLCIATDTHDSMQ